jgi:hypothetical protein
MYYDGRLQQIYWGFDTRKNELKNFNKLFAWLNQKIIYGIFSWIWKHSISTTYEK